MNIQHMTDENLHYNTLHCRHRCNPQLVLYPVRKRYVILAWRQDPCALKPTKHKQRHADKLMTGDSYTKTKIHINYGRHLYNLEGHQK